MNHLFLGLGSIGKRNLRSCLRVRSQDTFYALRHGRQSSALESDLGQVKALADWHEVERVRPDVVWICSPTHVHAEQIQEVASRLPQLKGIFLEKPLSHRDSDLLQIERTLNSKLPDTVFFYGCILRQHPLVQQTREWLAEGVIGQPMSYEFRCGSDLRTWRPDQDYRKSYSARKDMGGGVHLDLIHEFDLSQFFFGTPSSVGGKLAHLSQLEIDSADYCVALLEHSGGVRGTIHLDYFRKTPVRRFEILGQAGVIEGDLIRGTLTTTGKASDFSVSRDELHDRQTRAFLEDVAHKRQTWKLAEAIQLNRQVVALENAP